ncbi:hypothetical protein L1887_07534 [Cichorium endivia]|nr:hypothetical protein L1887_07534 [Cichorium endivia]
MQGGSIASSDVTTGGSSSAPASHSGGPMIAPTLRLHLLSYSPPLTLFFSALTFDINCRCGLVAWQLRLFLTATFLVDSFLHCCGPLQNTCTGKLISYVSAQPVGFSDLRCYLFRLLEFWLAFETDHIAFAFERCHNLSPHFADEESIGQMLTFVEYTLLLYRAFLASPDNHTNGDKDHDDEEFDSEIKMMNETILKEKRPTDSAQISEEICDEKSEAAQSQLGKLGYGSELTDFISNGYYRRNSVGAGEESSPAKNSKPNSTQETTPQPPYPDWSQIPTEWEFRIPFRVWLPDQIDSFRIPREASYGAAIWDSAPGVYGHPGMPLTSSQPMRFINENIVKKRKIGDNEQMGQRGGGGRDSSMKESHGRSIFMQALHSQCATILMAGGDTFRAAASDQLGIWAERTGCEIVLAEKEKAKAPSMSSNDVMKKR